MDITHVQLINFGKHLVGIMPLHIGAIAENHEKTYTYISNQTHLMLRCRQGHMRCWWRGASMRRRWGGRIDLQRSQPGATRAESRSVGKHGNPRCLVVIQLQISLAKSQLRSCRLCAPFSPWSARSVRKYSIVNMDFSLVEILWLHATKPNDISVWMMKVGKIIIPFTGYWELYIFLPLSNNLTWLTESCYKIPLQQLYFTFPIVRIPNIATRNKDNTGIPP